MDTWIDIRRRARACHEAALTTSKGDRRAKAIVTAALQNLDLEVRYYEPGSMYNDEVFGALDRTSKLVNVAKYQSPEEERVVIAHEIGHYSLHVDPTNEVTIRSVGLGGDPVDGAAGKVEGYSPRERKEIQADVFAGELLCPADWLRDEFVARRRRPQQVAVDLELPPSLVMNQLIRALLLPPLRPVQTTAPIVALELDPSQKAAATWRGGALLVDAGPGTGKTRTLIQRIKHCLDNGAMPGTILALTFSNKAAEEMNERLSAMNADAAVEMWVGTFHSFGMELITKWPAAIGRSIKVKIFDEAAALALLESNLEKLSLRHFQNLYEPAYELVHVLRAISRCKDELIAPEAYRAEAEAAFEVAEKLGDEDALRDAEKALEIAAVYEVYEVALKDADAVDFGDLVRLAATLVESNADVKSYVTRFAHILVDEYQDVNLASARLLRALCKHGATPWVVADQRQSIYRFRGAQPSNVTRFTDEFGGAKLSLAHNYRSTAPIVRVFERFSASMGDGGAMTGNWTANRVLGGSVTMTVALTVAAEAESIRDKVEAFRAAGIPYCEQAILARSHLTLARITGVLEHLNVPLLYLGDLFERSEVRDLLSLVALDGEAGNVGLPRIAALAEYNVGREDALIVRHWADTNKVSIIKALNRVSEIPDVSAGGRPGLALLGQHLGGLETAPPWTMLTTWLFERSGYLRPLLEANDPNSRQKLIAIYQLLKVCSEQLVAEDSSRKRFLARIRRIEALNQDGAYRAVSSEASDIDAVRVLTIHGSKGLEFGAVHFPALATRYMPSSRQAVRCPAPQGLTQLTMQSGDHAAEEECLFFVGLSRARDVLSLSRAERYTTQNSNPSKFLSSVDALLESTRHNGSGISFAPAIARYPQPARGKYHEHEVSLYIDCPARYRYEVVDEVRGGRDVSPYIQFHRCVYVVVGWLEREREEGRTLNLAAALALLKAEWDVRGPIGHGFEKYYWIAAEGMVRAMTHALQSETGRYERNEWLVPIASSHVTITPDRVLITPEGTVQVQRNRIGKKTKSDPDNRIYALLRRGAALRYPGQPISIEAFYLATSEVVSIAANKDDKKLEEYAKAIAGIEAGDFQPEPEQRKCPNCQSYFTCGR